MSYFSLRIFPFRNSAKHFEKFLHTQILWKFKWKLSRSNIIQRCRGHAVKIMFRDGTTQKTWEKLSSFLNVKKYRAEKFTWWKWKWVLFHHLDYCNRKSGWWEAAEAHRYMRSSLLARNCNLYYGTLTKWQHLRNSWRIAETGVRELFNGGGSPGKKKCQLWNPIPSQLFSLSLSAYIHLFPPCWRWLFSND